MSPEARRRGPALLRRDWQAGLERWLHHQGDRSGPEIELRRQPQELRMPPLREALFGRLALWVIEPHQEAPEDVIARQQQEVLELSTPVVKLWKGVLDRRSRRLRFPGVDNMVGASSPGMRASTSSPPTPPVARAA